MAKILATLRFRNEIDKMFKRDGIEAVRHWADVSIKAKHYCKDCFCCACLDYLKTHKEEIEQ